MAGYDSLLSSLATMAQQSGKNSRRERDLDRRNQRYAFNKNYDLQQERLDANNQQFYDGLQFRGEQAELNRDASLQERQLYNEAMLQNAQARGQGRVAAPRLPEIDRYVQKGLAEGTLEYTGQQKQKMFQLNQAAQRMALNKNYSPQQKSQALQQIYDEMGTVRNSPSVKMPNTDPTTEEVVKAKSWKDPASGDTWWVGKDGVLQYRPGEPKEMSDEKLLEWIGKNPKINDKEGTIENWTEADVRANVEAVRNGLKPKPTPTPPPPGFNMPQYEPEPGAPQPSPTPTPTPSPEMSQQAEPLPSNPTEMVDGKIYIIEGKRFRCNMAEQKFDEVE